MADINYVNKVKKDSTERDIHDARIGESVTSISSSGINTSAGNFTFPSVGGALANDSSVVHKTGDETITGIKRFTSSVTHFTDEVVLNNGAIDINAITYSIDITSPINHKITKYYFDSIYQDPYVYTFPSKSGTLAVLSDLDNCITTSLTTTTANAIPVFGSTNKTLVGSPLSITVPSSLDAIISSNSGGIQLTPKAGSKIYLNADISNNDDGATDIGESNHRFKDLYLFGNVKLGDTNGQFVQISKDNIIIGPGSNTPYTISYPTSGGTLALVSQIPSSSSFVTLSDAQTITGAKTFDSNNLTVYYNSGAPSIKFQGAVSGWSGTTTLQAGTPGGSSITLTLPSASGTIALTSDVKTSKIYKYYIYPADEYRDSVSTLVVCTNKNLNETTLANDFRSSTQKLFYFLNGSSVSSYGYKIGPAYVLTSDNELPILKVERSGYFATATIKPYAFFGTSSGISADEYTTATIGTVSKVEINLDEIS